MRDAWIGRALDVPRAFGVSLGTGRLRIEPEDFIVDEDLGFAPAGAGAHVLVRVRKRGANTEWVAGQIARHASCRPHDVGFAGLKDRHAVTTQWFSVPSPRGAAYVGDTIARLAGAKGEGYEVLEAHAHAKKLPRGALAGNRFTIRVRDVAARAGARNHAVSADALDAVRSAAAGGVAALDAAITARIAAISRAGLPNFFGPQRFGRDGANLRKIAPDLSAVHPRERTYVLSAARSLVFNAVLAERVNDGSWCRLEPGDVANLDGTGSVFPVDAVDETLTNRVAALDVHPTGPMWGRGEPLSQGRVRDLEQRVGAELADACALVIAAGMNQERRALRLSVRELDWERQGEDVVVRFWLTKGSFATTVLRELFDTDGAEEDS
jgi:tRNA pseudouridine13 synthase